MDTYEQTKLAYEESAKELVKHWDSTGPRGRHIELAFRLAGTDKPVVLELGCGPGRDAALIVKKTKEYIGIDYSSGLIDIATDKVPGGTFVLGDIVTTPFPEQRDVIIAFASLIHLDEAKVKRVFEKAGKALRIGGIFYVSTKDGRGTVTKSDGFGTRTYYLYKTSELVKIAGKRFMVVYKDIERIRDQDWVEVAFKRVL
ncbi:MAG TPA: class I SAM-dependent methyltransferase [Candidatus Saccharimonadales bacterium]|nr:class I SAM-dependent methyltransferase [Candidatus Saccharimonadales bacterium]